MHQQLLLYAMAAVGLFMVLITVVTQQCMQVIMALAEAGAVEGETAAEYFGEKNGEDLELPARSSNRQSVEFDQ